MKQVILVKFLTQLIRNILLEDHQEVLQLQLEQINVHLLPVQILEAQLDSLLHFAELQVLNQPTEEYRDGE